MASTPSLAIKAAGMVTPVGFNASSSCAAIRAGIRNINQTNLWDPESGSYLGAGKVPLPQWWVGTGKLAELAAPAILECFEAARPIPPREIPILLGVAPKSRPFRLPGIDANILSEIEHRFGFDLHPASRVVPRDHVSVVPALQEANDLIRGRRAPCVIVAAVDSLLQHDLLEYYLSKRRLLTPDNSNGFSLGEAGAAILVGPASDDPKVGEMRVLGMAIAQEPATIESSEPLRGDALTLVIRKVLDEAELTIRDVHYRITDLNGEHYRFKEVALAMGRFARTPTRKPFGLWHPIECIGDVGAAIGVIVAGHALHASRNEYAVGPTVLCTLSNDDGERAAFLMSYRGRRFTS